MKVNGEEYRTIWMEESSVFMIEQNLLPFEFKIHECKSYFDTCFAITTMIVRGAGAIGAAAGFAMAQAMLEAPNEGFMDYVLQAKEDIEVKAAAGHFDIYRYASNRWPLRLSTIHTKIIF